MDKASDYESGDSRFESWQGRFFCVTFLCIALYKVMLLANCLDQSSFYMLHIETINSYRFRSCRNRIKNS